MQAERKHKYSYVAISDVYHKKFQITYHDSSYSQYGIVKSRYEGDIVYITQAEAEGNINDITRVNGI